MSERDIDLCSRDLTQWQRLSPWSILYFIGRTLRGFVDPNLVFILAPAYGLYQVMDNTLYFVLTASIFVPLLIVGAAIFQYVFFFFRVDDNNFQIRQGLLFKRHLDLPFYRIQDVTIDKPFYFKPLGLVSATLDTAGSSESEAVLAAVSSDFAADLREWIFRQDQEADVESGDVSETVNQTVDQVDRQPVFHRNVSDIVIHGLTNNKVWIILAALFPFIERILQHRWDEFMASQGNSFSALLEAGAWSAWIAISGIVLGFIAVMAVLSVIGSLVVLYRYEIYQTPDSLSRESGLFSRQQINLKIRRVQFINITQSLFDRLFSRHNLVYRQLEPAVNNQRMNNTTFLVPSVDSSEVRQLVSLVYKDCDFSPESIDHLLKPVSKRFILKLFLTRSIPFAIFLSGLIYWTELYSDPAAAFVVVATAGFFLNCLAWYRQGYRESDAYIVIRSGLFGKSYQVFPDYKIQQLSIHQSYPMRRNQHCNLSLVLGLAGLRIPYIPLSEGSRIADRLLYQVESSQRSWM